MIPIHLFEMSLVIYYPSLNPISGHQCYKNISEVSQGFLSSGLTTNSSDELPPFVNQYIKIRQ